MNDAEIADLTDHLGEFVRTPSGLGRIRREILGLAVAGKLVSQDTSEGTAADLLRQIDEVKTALAAAGRARSPSKLRAKHAVVPFDIPSSWCWTEASAICAAIVDGDHQPPPRSFSGVPFVVIGDVSHGTLDLATVSRKVPRDYFEKLDWAHRPQEGDVLFTTVGSFGIALAVPSDREFCFQRHIGMFRPAVPQMQRYLYRFLQSPVAFDHAKGVATGIAQKTVPLSGLRTMPVPLPPLGEQLRIARRVDELFELIDRIDDALVSEGQARSALSAAALRDLEEDGDETVLSLFGELLDSADDVDSIEGVILQLAVTGRLTRRDPNDEPASEFISRVQKYVLDKPDLVNGSGAKIKEPYEAPASWLWVALGSVLEGIQAGWSPSAQARPKEGDEWGVLKVSACSWGEFRPQENKALGPGQKPRKEIEVKPGDFLLSRANTSELVARSVVVHETPPRLMLSDKTLRLAAAEGCNIEYLNIANGARATRDHYEAEATGTSSSMKNVSQRAIRRAPIPLPPSAEQTRIVAVVNDLLALTRRLRTVIE